MSRDAEDAVRDRDGYDYDGYSLRVEWPHGEKGSSSRGRSGNYGGSYGGGGGGGSGGGRPRGGGGYVRGRPPRGPPVGARHSDYRVLITGIVLLLMDLVVLDKSYRYKFSKNFI